MVRRKRRHGARGATKPSGGRDLLSVLRARHADSVGSDRLVAIVLCGQVRVDGEVIRDPKARIDAHAAITIAARAYVSRAGDKLNAALARLQLDVSDLVIIDAGAATGGFTDCVLRHGARLVYSVDVGVGLLADRLRRDSRVSDFSGRNIMSLTTDDLRQGAGAAVVDLSFRSLSRAARHVLDLTSGGWVLCLAKPQFEWATPPPEFRGVVHARADRRAILLDLVDTLYGQGTELVTACPSAVRGARGNQEYFLLLRHHSALSRAAQLELIEAVADER